MFSTIAEALSCFLYINIQFDDWGKYQGVIQPFFYAHIHSFIVLGYGGAILPNRTIFPDLRAISSWNEPKDTLEQMGVEKIFVGDMLEVCRRHGMER
ncbi:hypothetical protein BT69DRAFT_1282332 [Atractiella rhizophila]|nr:hypothetical protein BT69DRAFT_1282332 [Atractiella rhizophila]